MSIAITLVYSPGPRQTEEIVLRLPNGSTVAQALQLSGLWQLFPWIQRSGVAPGVWGRRASLKQILKDQDRVEIYRPLKVDPKVARRERFKKQGTRAAGLFAKKRTGAKAGY